MLACLATTFCSICFYLVARAAISGWDRALGPHGHFLHCPNSWGGHQLPFSLSISPGGLWSSLCSLMLVKRGPFP